MGWGVLIFRSLPTTGNYAAKGTGRVFHHKISKFSIFNSFILLSGVCCIFRPAFGFCAPQMLVEIVIFSVFLLKSLTMQKFDSKSSKKTLFFSVCTKTLVECFIPKKIAFSLKKHFLPMKSLKSFDLGSNTGQNKQQPTINRLPGES